jgi:hypothetical protein
MAQAKPGPSFGHHPLTRHIAGAAALYFLIVFGVGFVLGPVRVLWLEPMIGVTAATLCEAPLLLAAMVFAAVLVPKKFGSPTDVGTLLTMGLIALAMLIVADVTVGTAIRGTTWAEQAAYFATPGGLIYLGLLVAFTVMPALLNARYTPD